MKTGEAATASGLPIRTIRYYEGLGHIGLERNANGYRNFNDNDVQKLRLLHRARHLAFSSDECRSLVALFENQNRTCSDVKQLAAARVAEIDRKLSELQSLRQALASLVDTCHGEEKPMCPLLDELTCEARQEQALAG